MLQERKRESLSLIDKIKNSLETKKYEKERKELDRLRIDKEYFDLVRTRAIETAVEKIHTVVDVGLTSKKMSEFTITDYDAEKYCGMQGKHNLVLEKICSSDKNVIGFHNLQRIFKVLEYDLDEQLKLLEEVLDRLKVDFNGTYNVKITKIQNLMGSRKVTILRISKK